MYLLSFVVKPWTKAPTIVNTSCQILVYVIIGHFSDLWLVILFEIVYCIFLIIDVALVLQSNTKETSTYGEAEKLKS